jgi:predicted nucleotidyltransferase component of viral defense system
MKDVIQEKLESYDPQTNEDEENAIKEITQEVVLYGLDEAGFFKHAVFQGGTCLRIIHGLDRFSEDLDFVLKTPTPDFDLNRYLTKVSETMKLYGYGIEVTGEDKANESVKPRFLKDDSIKKLLKFSHKQDLKKKIQIKVEVDINPPAGDKTEANYLDFPTQFMVVTHDIPSLLAGKAHALLCRSYVKGRDWYDYLWYIRKNEKVNLAMLENALNQLGPWKDQGLKIDKEWLHEKLNEKVNIIHWDEAKRDVERFLKPEEKKTLKLWSEDFFLKMTKKFIADQA